MRADGKRERIAAMASMPFRSGLWRSLRVTSGRCFSKAVTASRPLAASATTSTSGSSWRTAVTPCRSSGWSSTTMTRIVRSVDIADLRGHVELDFGAGAVATSHEQARSELLRALAHAGHAPMAGESVLDDVARDSLSVVADAHAQVRGSVFD